MTKDEGPRPASVLPSFPSLDDLLGELRHLAQAHAARVAFFSYGHSRQGEPLWGLRLGDGPRRILAYAFPQPDEPLGGVVLLRLVRHILEDEALARQANWTLLPCVDPDGARHNEAWFTALPDLAAYARRAFRPSEGEQVEWSFESDDPAWPWERPLAETRALQGLIGDLRPELLFPLHNALLGGAYAFLSPDLAGLAPRLAAVWARHGLPTHLGEPELPFAAVLSPGVYALPTLAEMAAALSAQGAPDPPGLLGCGAPGYLYARRYGPAWTAVLELPLFTVVGIDDTRPAGCSRRALLERALSADRDALQVWREWYGQAGPFLEAGNPYQDALEAHRRSAAPLLAATARWLESDPSLERSATVAEEVESQKIAPYLRLLPLGTLLQALQAEAGWRQLRKWEQRLLLEVRAGLEESLAGVLAALPATPVAFDVLIAAVEEAVCNIAQALLRLE